MKTNPFFMFCCCHLIFKAVWKELKCVYSVRIVSLQYQIIQLQFRRSFFPKTKFIHESHFYELTNIILKTNIDTTNQRENKTENKYINIKMESIKWSPNKDCKLCREREREGKTLTGSDQTVLFPSFFFCSKSQLIWALLKMISKKEKKDVKKGSV